jgi:hypothetical protein
MEWDLASATLTERCATCTLCPDLQRQEGGGSNDVGLSPSRGRVDRQSPTWSRD